MVEPIEIQNQEIIPEVANAFAVPEGMMIEDSENPESKVIIPGVQNTPHKVEPIPKIEDQPTDVKYNPLWDQFAKKFGTTEKPFEIPANVKEGKFDENTTEMDAFLSSALQHLDPVSEILNNLPSTVQDYLLKAGEDNFDEKAWLSEKLNSVSMYDQPNENFMQWHLNKLNGKSEQNPNGWDEDIIKKQVETMKNSGILDMQAESLKRDYKQVEDKQKTEQATLRANQEQNSFNEFIQKHEKVIEDSLEKNQTINEAFGIKFSEAEMTQYRNDFKNLMKIDPLTKTHQIHKWLQSDENVYKLGMLLSKTEEGVKTYISKMKEGLKEDLLDKTNIEPKRKTGAPLTQPNAFDSIAFGMPEQIKEQVIN